MGKKFKGGMKKIIVEALAVAFLLMPSIQPPAGAGGEILWGEVLVESGLQEADNGGDDGIMPCGDFVDDDENVHQSNS